MKKLYVLFFLSICCYQVEAQRSPTTKRPNVIIVLSDDQGYGDFSCHGNPIVQTPAFDKLYSESVRFSNFHVSPLCTPSRGELMSGLDAMHNLASTVLFGRGIIRRDVPTMPEIFKQNGYHTGIFGKWHLGDSYPDRPMDRGFEKCEWFKGWGLLSEAEYDNDYYKTRYLDSLKPVESGKYCTDLWFDEAMKWMGEKAARQQPFFTYLALNVTHGPFYSPQEDLDFYKNKVDNRATASFFGMIRNMDNNMARLDKWLEEKHLKDNTLIVFMNDNGGTGGIKVYNAGMRGEKGSVYDGGHRAVCFMRWPNGTLGMPRTISYPSEIQDLLPTFIDLFNFKKDSKRHFDGESLKPVLNPSAKKLNDRMFVVQYMETSKPQKYQGCVVWNNWRLVGENELYDLSKDPGQQNNIAAGNPQILKKMQAFYEQWWAVTVPWNDQRIPLIVGSEKENPVTLTSNEWLDESVNTQWAVAQAKGNVQGGVWKIHAEKKGKYRLELSRWPAHLNRDMTIAGLETAIGGTKLRTGRAMPVAAGCVMVNAGTPLVVKSEPGATKIAMDINLNAGDQTLQAWFKNKDGQDICGAYYVSVKWLAN